MAYLEHVIQQPEVHRLGLTLLHFLWQGTAVAIALAFVLQWLRTAGANSRYVAALVALVLMAAMPVATFLLVKPPVVASDVGSETAAEPATSESKRVALPDDLYKSLATSDEPPPFQAVEAGSDSADTALKHGAETPVAAGSPSLMTWAERIQPFLPWLVLAWAVGVLLLSLRLAGSWFHVVRLARCHTQPVVESIDRSGSSANAWASAGRLPCWSRQSCRFPAWSGSCVRWFCCR